MARGVTVLQARYRLRPRSMPARGAHVGRTLRVRAGEPSPTRRRQITDASSPAPCTRTAVRANVAGTFPEVPESSLNRRMWCRGAGRVRGVALEGVRRFAPVCADSGALPCGIRLELCVPTDLPRR